MRILLTGKGGQIGWELHKLLPSLGEVVAPTRDELDLADPDQIRARVESVQPDLIVNAAGYTAVDQAEKEVDLARKINSTAPGILAEESRRIGAALIHFSTDYVFDGKQNGPYVEEDAPHPLSVYGQTKLGGEQTVQEANIPHLILRTSWVYGWRRKNFLLTIQTLARERKEIRVVNDQMGAPTWCRTIAEKTLEILKKYLNNSSTSRISFKEELSGIYHLTCGGETSWYGFAEALLNRLDPNHRVRLVPIPTSQYPTPAERPGNSVLSNARVRRVFGVEMPPWEEALKQCLAETTSN